MKTTVKEQAYAKINLTMDVLEKQLDGYHEIKSVMQALQLCDEITLTKTEGADLVLTSNWDTIPLDETNTAAKAVRAFENKTDVSVGGLTIHLEKKIPVEAGVGGGSSDAAAVLRGLNQMYETNLSHWELAELGEKVGADVPFCVYGNTAFVEGKGERVQPLIGLPACFIVLCKPDFSLSTTEMYQRIDEMEVENRPDVVGVLLGTEWEDVQAIAKRVSNVFEVAVPQEEKDVIAEIKKTMLDQGAIGAAMSGSGPLVYGIFTSNEKAKAAADALKATYSEVFLTQPV